MDNGMGNNQASSNKQQPRGSQAAAKQQPSSSQAAAKQQPGSSNNNYSNNYGTNDCTRQITCKERAARLRPSRQKPSVIGFAMLLTNGSRHCVKASRPQLA
jgi:hypothetical protein